MAQTAAAPSAFADRSNNAGAQNQDRPPGQQAPAGLVWAYRFDENGRGSPVTPFDADLLSDTATGFFWLHFDLVDQRVHGWCKEQLPLSAAAKAVFLSADGHIRIDHHEGQ